MFSEIALRMLAWFSNRAQIVIWTEKTTSSRGLDHRGGYLRVQVDISLRAHLPRHKIAGAVGFWGTRVGRRC